MMSDPLASVIIPVYNGTNYLAEAVASVRTQTYPRIELIIVDDGSTDDTWQLIQSFGDTARGIRKDNGGVASALNRGIQAAQGRYIAWLSHDDLFLPDKIERQVDFVRGTPDVEACFTDYRVIESDGTPVRDIVTVGLPRIQLLRELFRRSLIDGSTTLIARSVYQTVGPFNEQRRYTQDLEMWMRILNQYSFARLPEVLGQQRQHPGRDSSNVTKHLAEQRDLYSEQFNALGVSGLFPDLDGDPDSPQEIAFAHRWFGDAMAHGHHFFDLADHHYRVAAAAWSSWRNPARIRALVGARMWTAPHRMYQSVRHELGALRHAVAHQNR